MPLGGIVRYLYGSSLSALLPVEDDAIKIGHGAQIDIEPLVRLGLGSPNAGKMFGRKPRGVTHIPLHAVDGETLLTGTQQAVVYLIETPPHSARHIILHAQLGVGTPLLQGNGQLHHAKGEFHLIAELVGVGADQLFGAIARKIFPFDFAQLFPSLSVA